MMLWKAETVGGIETKELCVGYRNSELLIHCRLRSGRKGPLLFLHGLGCSIDDFLQAYETASLSEYTLASFDFPGCGRSSYTETTSLDVDDLVALTAMAVSQLALKDIVLIGHSMGGLVALLYSDRYTRSVRALVSVEGNLVRDDCFFSRKVAGTDYSLFRGSLFPDFVHGIKMRDNRGFREYARTLEQYTNPRAFYDYCSSLVAYSDSGMLLEKMLKLGLPTLFLYGSEDRDLPSIRELKRGGVRVVEIANSNHFPQYDNPNAFYKKIFNFIHTLA
jgi:pimeloyl-ACP methyl ester carboxylesterase